MLSKQNRLWGAILLVSGTTIGAGMLALPVTTGQAGFFPSLLLMTFIWLFMMLTAFYFLEVNLRLKGESNLISMMRKTLGKPGEIISWVVYLLLLYSLLAAYIVGCSQILSDFFGHLLPHHTPTWLWPVIIFAFFGSFVYFGTEVVDFLNRILMIGLVGSYIGLIGSGANYIQFSYLYHHEWKYLLAACSVIVTSFGYHIIIPTLTTYLEHDSKLLKKAIFIGSFIPFIIYLVWQLLAMGIIPAQGDVSLSSAAEKGLQVTFYLKMLINSQWIGHIARFFALFAIITSLLGVALSLADFLSDGLKIKKTLRGKFVLMLITFLPPLFFALFYPDGFITALNYAGIFVVILLCLMPALMSWKERYGKDKDFVESPFKVPGGKWLLSFTILVSLILLGIEVYI